jgi:glycosyltransferase involved in cell wall biosynthesis
VSAGRAGRGRVCFHADYLYPLFSGRTVPFAGGAETQQALLARGLVGRGFEVTVATCDYGQPGAVVVDGVRLLRTFKPRSGVPVLRFFHPRLSRTVRALAAADAEVYYTRGAGVPAGIAFEVARARRAAFVLGTAHEHDARRALALHRNPRDRWWARRVIRGADLVIAQTEHQRALYAAEFGRASEVVPNLVEIPAAAVDAGQEGAIVWLATYKPAKRPEWFLELARRLPRRRLVMSGVMPVPPDTRASWEAAQAAARELPNLELRGFVDPARVGELFAGAALFVHTSPAEGFPNTLLEAWAHGIPSLSVVDPDGVVARERLGEIVTSVAGLVAAAERWMADPALRRDTGARARAHVARHHAPAIVLERFSGLLDAMVEKARRARARG